MATWIFQGNPAQYDIRGAVRHLQELDWRVTRHQDKIQPGDRVFIWESGRKGGIVGVARVLDRPSIRPDRPEEDRFVLDAASLDEDALPPRVTLQIMQVVDPVLGRKEIRDHPELACLSILQQPRGTNFPVTLREAETIEDLLGRRDR